MVRRDDNTSGSRGKTGWNGEKGSPEKEGSREGEDGKENECFGACAKRERGLSLRCGMRQEAPGLACSGRQRGLESKTDEARPGKGEDGRQSLPLVVKYSDNSGLEYLPWEGVEKENRQRVRGDRIEGRLDESNWPRNGLRQDFLEREEEEERREGGREGTRESERRG